MTLRTKIIIPKLILILTLALVFTYLLSFMKSNEIVIKENQIQARHVIEYSNTLELLHTNIEKGLLNYSLTRDPAKAEAVRQYIQQINAIVTNSQIVVTDPVETELLDKYRDSLDGYGPIIFQLNNAIRTADAHETEIAFSKLTTKTELIHATLQDLNTYSTRRLEQSASIFQELINTTMRIVLIIFAISILVTVANLYFLYYSVTVPLAILAAAAKEISLGNFEVLLPPAKTQDEVGQLSSSIKNMTQELRALYFNLEAEVRKKTAALSVQNVELSRSNKELEDFAYVASHDLQEPLRKIQAFGDLLEEEYKDTLNEKGKDYLSRMKSAANRMSTLISDLLVFSRVTTKAQPFVPVNLTAIVQDVLIDMEMRIKDVEGVIEVDSLPTVEADPVQMRQMVQNLISNALKFHKKGETPRVRIYSQIDALADKECYDIFFEDNGIGIDEKYADKIFTVFQRLHTKDEYPGTGIGLAVVKKIVDRHGGGIRLRSQPGKGSTFIVTLLRHQEDAEESN